MLQTRVWIYGEDSESTSVSPSSRLGKSKVPWCGCHCGAWQSTVKVKGQVASRKVAQARAWRFILGDSDLSVAGREPWVDCAEV